jgi:hypothetical protein
VDASNPIISTTVFGQGDYWLHVGSYHGGNIPFDEVIQSTNIGPFHVFSQTGSDPHVEAIAISSTSIRWRQSHATGSNFLDANCAGAGGYYGFQLTGGATSWICADAINPAIIDFVSQPLTPNTSFTMYAFLRDSLGNITGPDVKTAATLQVTPVSVVASNV